MSPSMLLRKMFPCALAACSIIAASSLSVRAQKEETRSRRATTVSLEYSGTSGLESEQPIIYLASPEEVWSEDLKPSKRVTGSRSSESQSIEQLISAAIDERLGARYSWGSTGPFAFDCSGFVWSTFHSAGIDFERGNARALWSRFVPAAPEEEFKFGTLVFFSGLTHIGIVADEYGFYHASRHHGVVYSPFNDYWLSRIDGFRRVPMPASLTD
jgi:cell wall-associated NlpC family hydrolase